MENFRNEYVAVRHGESEANVLHLISSDPTIGVECHGLTSNGRKQVEENSTNFIENHSSTRDFLIVSSDFRRARETAEILFSQLSNCSSIIEFDRRLRERFFGIFDGKSDENYSSIWSNDENDSEKNDKNQIESVENVRKRTWNLIVELEEKYRGKTIFLVSHGDALQILQTKFERWSNANRHRHLPHLERAEFRRLVWKFTS